MIGIIGGVGPLAGVDTYKKIIEETQATSDQDHLPVLLYSLPDRISDRTAFLLDRQTENPGHTLANIAIQLEKAGATVVAIPCNTAHAEPIFSIVENRLEETKSTVRLLHIVKETVKFVQQNYPNAKVGILSTTGTRQEKIYSGQFEDAGLTFVEPSDADQDRVHHAIYHEEYGIKAQSSPISEQARKELQDVLNNLNKQGASLVILGCTELPLALPENTYHDMVLVDPNRILARALIHAINPEKLKEKQ